MAETLDLSSLGPILYDDVNTYLRRLGLGITVENTKSSPVDSGRFKNNWIIGINMQSDATRLTTSSAPLGAESAEAVIAANNSLSSFDIRKDTVIHISNNLPYAERLANGYSQQVSAGWVDMNIRNELKSLENSIGT